MLKNHKTLFFSFLALLIPIIFFVILETGLRFFDFNGKQEIFLQDEANANFLRVNPETAKFYFSNSTFRPSPSPDVISKTKNPNTVRIFVFGGSSTAGYPYLFSGTFPAMLKQRLADVFSENTVEVVNFGMTATNSFTVLDLVKQSFEYEPDLFLIYSGHNEFYGALGTGSAQSAPFGSTDRNFTLFYLQLKKFKTLQLLQLTISKIVDFFASSTNQQEQSTLMGQMAKEQEIPINSELYNKTLEIFEQNILEVIELAKQKNVPVLLGTLASNLKDHKPFVSIQKAGIDKKDFEAKIEKAREFAKNENYKEALKTLQQALKIDSANALANFYAAKCFDFLGNYQNAKQFYTKAKDYDGLRFRASSDLNKILFKLAKQPKVFLTDTEKALSEATKNKIIGNELMLEHLHPNLEGYFLMAKAFSQTILENKIFNFKENPAPKTDEELRKEIPVTSLDLKIAEIRIKILVSNWPFKGKNLSVDDFQLQNEVEKQAVAVLKKQSDYEKSHVELARFYTQQNRIDEAISEYKVLSETFPTNESPLLAISDLLIKSKRFDEALPFLEKTVSLVENDFSYKWIGTISLNNKDFSKGVKFLEKAVSLNPKDEQATYNLAGSYFFVGDTNKAISTVEALLKRNPNFPNGQNFYNQLVNSKTK
ncbi:tetratricopeptide repeat protein [bacterium]|nr:tetratricopeptide repeat protein [bacterium]